MSSTPTPPATGEVYLSYVRALFQYLEEQGRSVAPLLDALALTPADLDDADRRIGADAYARLWARAADACGDSHLGLHAGAVARPGKYGILGFAMMACETLGEALLRQRRYQDLVGKTGVSELHAVSTDLAELRWHSPLAGLSRHIGEEHVSSWVAFANLLIGDSERALYVCFEHAPHGEPALYERVLGCPARFSQPYTAVAFPTALLARPVRDQNPTLRRLLDGHAEQLLADRRRQRDDMIADAWQAVSAALVNGAPTLEDIAQRLGCSARVLQRRLGERDQTFKDLVDEVRHALALRYIADPKLSLLDIAFLLGFSEQSGFQRAFKRWAGTTPGLYRAGG
ncbi:MAG TPA: AraC family transcriptional regulator [Solimonas sp.]